MNKGLLLIAGNSSSMGIFSVVYIVAILAFFYFILIRPQRKEQRAKEALMERIAIGDSVLTTAGFYGTIIDVSDDTVIVEFGNNRNCRIPMQKSAIVQLEKPEDALATSEDKAAAEPEKKGLFKK